MNIGTDIIEIKRIKKSAENPRFLSRIFSTSELKYLSENNFNAETMAGCFCVKEAVFKAFGVTLKEMPFNEISVLHDYSGAPYVSLSGNSRKIQQEKKVGIKVSISHCRDYATAVALVYDK